MIAYGDIHIKISDEAKVILTIETTFKSKYDELEGEGFSLKEALQDLLEQVEDLAG